MMVESRGQGYLEPLGHMVSIRLHRPTPRHFNKQSQVLQSAMPKALEETENTYKRLIPGRLDVFFPLLQRGLF